MLRHSYSNFAEWTTHLDEGVAAVVLLAMEMLADLMIVPDRSMAKSSCTSPLGKVILTRPWIHLVYSPFFEFAWQSLPSGEIELRTARFPGLVLFRLCNRSPL